MAEETIRRFIAMHESETGFDSPAACQDWIYNNPQSRGDIKAWRVVEIRVDPVTEQLAFGDLAREKEASYIQGQDSERKRIARVLGL